MTGFTVLAKARARGDLAATLAVMISTIALIVASIGIASPALAQPSITLSPNRGPVGTAVQVTGSEFAGGRHRSLLWDDTITIAEVDTTDTGTITTTFTVPAGATPGDHTVGVVVGVGSPIAEATFTVEPRTEQKSPEQKPQPEPKSGECERVAFIGAAGSGEKQGTYGATVNAVRERLVPRFGGERAVVDQAVNYPAANVSKLLINQTEILHLFDLGNRKEGFKLFRVGPYNAYMDSIDEGTDATYDLLLNRAKADACPDERIILAGYSQGAAVIHRSLLRLSDEGKAGILDRVIAVVLVANPDRVRGSATKHLGTAPASGSKGEAQGIASRFRLGERDIPNKVIDRTVNICDDGDIVCDFDLDAVTHLPRGVKIHFGYADQLSR